MPRHDIVLRGGFLIDGTGNPWYPGDIAIQKGHISAIGNIPRNSGQREIDVTGLIVCPGFIDMHTHSDMPLLVDGTAQSKVRQGVTLDIIGESQSVTPLEGVVLEEYRVDQKRRDGVDVNWIDLAGYFERIKKDGISINLASCVAPQQVRRAVIGFEDRPGTEEEIQTMTSLIAKAMEQGAVGISAAWHGGGPEYLDELIAMARTASRYGGFFGTHVGSEGFQLQEEIEKSIRVGEASGLPVHIYHLKVRGKPLWGKVSEGIQLIEEARGRGLDVTANQYPYTAMQHPWRRLFPRWIQDAPVADIVPKFRIQSFRDKVASDPEFHQYLDEHGGWEGIVASRVVNSSLKDVEGKTIAQVANMRNANPTDTCFDIVAEEGAFPFGVYHNMSEDDVRMVMAKPWVAIASDGSAINLDAPGKPHPRSFGTNVRVLGKYVRDEKVLTLEDAIRKMTSLPSQVLRLQDRGLLKPGYWADIVAFNPGTVNDLATFENPHQYANGVEYVLVNGTLVIDAGNHTGNKSGQVIYNRLAKDIP